MKIRIITLFIVFLIGLITFYRWYSCWLFAPNFYFTPPVLATNVIEATNLDKGLPILVVRMFHNKVLAFPWGILQSIVQFLDIRFLELFLSIVGGVGLYLGFWYLFTKYLKKKVLWGLVGLIIVYCIIEIVHPLSLTYAYRITPLFVLFELFSLFGIWEFLKGKNQTIRYLIVFSLIVLSFLSFLLFPLAYQDFCLKI